MSGRVSAGLVFRHADGAAYGGLVSPRAAELRTKAFQALRGLGFRETEVKRALEHVIIVPPRLTSRLITRLPSARSGSALVVGSSG